MTIKQGIICAQHRGGFEVLLKETKEVLQAQIKGSLRKELENTGIQLVTGDRVELKTEGEDLARITRMQERKSLLTRVEAGTRGKPQPLAANVDIAFICTSANEDFNTGRLERYLACAEGALVPTVLLITKADLVKDREGFLAQIHSHFPGREHLFCSAATGEGINQVLKHLEKGKTGVLLGSSGVGKSSLINALLGEDRLRTAGISAHQDKGRHTTTTRRLIPLQEGSYLMDTPGMRELALDQSDVQAAFQDIEEMAVHCKFRDCRHDKEPGCAVRQALSQGDLTRERFKSYQKLQKEEEGRAGRLPSKPTYRKLHPGDSESPAKKH